MYLVPIVAPIYADGERRLVTTDWKRALELLRDSFDGRFGEFVVLAPGADPATAAGVLEEVEPSRDGIELVPSIPASLRAREFWTSGRKRWCADVERLLARADVVHAGANDLFKPVMTIAWRAAADRGVPTVFVQDTDIVLQERELAAGDPVRRLRAALYGKAYERVVRSCVARADLSLLKGRDLVARYGPYARNVREFHDTSYLGAHVVGDAPLERRRERARTGDALRFVYCGRFVERKGLAHAVEWVARAARAGADVVFDLLGDGEQKGALEARVRELGVGERVRFLGKAAYGPELIGRLAEYDALLFTPFAEDTPRMIFDGYAAGLPLVATDIAYVRERAEAERAAVVLPRSDSAAAVATLVDLARDRRKLLELAPHALEAGRYHAADAWYARRAAWTVEAVERSRRAAA
ncbi:MAG: glycosyltransferase [Planctomycetota bacterium]